MSQPSLGSAPAHPCAISRVMSEACGCIDSPVGHLPCSPFLSDLGRALLSLAVRSKVSSVGHIHPTAHVSMFARDGIACFPRICHGIPGVLPVFCRLHTWKLQLVAESHRSARCPAWTAMRRGQPPLLSPRRLPPFDDTSGNAAANAAAWEKVTWRAQCISFTFCMDGRAVAGHKDRVGLQKYQTLLRFSSAWPCGPSLLADRSLPPTLPVPPTWPCLPIAVRGRTGSAVRNPRPPSLLMPEGTADAGRSGGSCMHL